MMNWSSKTENWLVKNCKESNVFTWGFTIVIFAIIIRIALM